MSTRSSSVLDPASTVARPRKATKRAKDEGDLTQAEKFKNAAREHGADQDEEAFGRAAEAGKDKKLSVMFDHSSLAPLVILVVITGVLSAWLTAALAFGRTKKEKVWDARLAYYQKTSEQSA